MIERLKRIICDKAGGSQKAFAEMMGWTPQYLSNLMTSRSGLGMNPVTAVLERFEDVNPRWFLFGKGTMYGTDEAAELRTRELERLEDIVSLGRYIPVMTEQERQRYCDTVLRGTPSDFTATEIVSLEYRLGEHRAKNEVIVNKAMEESICRTHKA